MTLLLDTFLLDGLPAVSQYEILFLNSVKKAALRQRRAHRRQLAREQRLRARGVPPEEANKLNSKNQTRSVLAAIRHLWGWIVGIGVLAGLASAAATFSPKISVVSSSTLDPKDVLQSLFTLSNDGLIPVKHVTTSMYISTLEYASGGGFRDVYLSGWVKESTSISPGDKTTIGFGNDTASPFAGVDEIAKSGECDVIIRYRLAVYWKPIEKHFHFHIRSTKSGDVLWAPESN